MGGFSDLVACKRIYASRSNGGRHTKAKGRRPKAGRPPPGRARPFHFHARFAKPAKGCTRGHAKGCKIVVDFAHARHSSEKNAAIYIYKCCTHTRSTHPRHVARGSSTTSHDEEEGHVVSAVSLAGRRAHKTLRTHCVYAPRGVMYPRHRSVLAHVTITNGSQNNQTHRSSRGDGFTNRAESCDRGHTLCTPHLRTS